MRRDREEFRDHINLSSPFAHNHSLPTSSRLCLCSACPVWQMNSKPGIHVPPIMGMSISPLPALDGNITFIYHLHRTETVTWERERKREREKEREKERERERERERETVSSNNDQNQLHTFLYLQARKYGLPMFRDARLIKPFGTPFACSRFCAEGRNWTALMCEKDKNIAHTHFEITASIYFVQ